MIQALIRDGSAGAWDAVDEGGARALRGCPRGARRGVDRQRVGAHGPGLPSISAPNSTHSLYQEPRVSTVEPAFGDCQNTTCGSTALEECALGQNYLCGERRAVSSRLSTNGCSSPRSSSHFISHKVFLRSLCRSPGPPLQSRLILCRRSLHFRVDQFFVPFHCKVDGFSVPVSTVEQAFGDCQNTACGSTALEECRVGQYWM